MSGNYKEVVRWIVADFRKYAYSLFHQASDEKIDITLVVSLKIWS